MEPTYTIIPKLMDAYDEAHALRKRLAYRFRNAAPHRKTAQVRQSLEAAMEAEEKARLELLNHENAIAMGGAA